MNRAGMPLMEIVTEPDARSPQEALAYLMKLRQILRYLGVSEANMEAGNFRCEPNLSLRPRGATEFGSKVELKNLNSFRAALRGTEFEVERQSEDPARGRPRRFRDPRLARRDPGDRPASARKSRPTTTATSRSRTCRTLAYPRERLRSCVLRLPELPDAKRARFESRVRPDGVRSEPADRVAHQG